MTPDRARDAILKTIANSLQGEPPRALPDPLEIFPDDNPVDRATLARTFSKELSAAGGETRFVASEDALPAAIAAIVAERGLGAVSMDFASAGYALLRADALVADSGSAVVIERSAERRVAPYLPRTCIIVGDASTLYPHLGAEAFRTAFAAARAKDRGEAVIITGPSRTADIEKTLVLGAHGPRDLIVFIVGVEA